MSTLFPRKFQIMQQLRNILFIVATLFLLTGFSQGGRKLPTGQQSARYRYSAPMEINASWMRVDQGRTYFDFDLAEDPAHVKELRLQKLRKYPKGYSTAYIINTTDTVFRAEGQDGSLMMIQEALDTKGKWRPIEYWVYSGCGNSYFGALELQPGCCAMIPIRQYRGGFATKIRLKMQRHTSLFYSESFAGSIDTTLFRKETQTVDGILYRGPAAYFEE
jgi:hypothetical protein